MDHIQIDMMTVGMIIGYLIFGTYLITLIWVTIFCLMQLHLLYHYKMSIPKSNFQNKHNKRNDQLPFITIQLPLYNEKYVVERLIDNIVLLDYPKDRLEIHVLDDSTDDTLNITKRKVEEYKLLGFNILCHNRKDRSGFKAGALKEGMTFANGDFIAIFDADFLPKRDFLIQTLPAFDDPTIGVVQTRWEHINQKFSLLTEMQAFQLNVHFTIEQKGRYNAGYFLQFNGTAGLWRKECILDAGSWEADTLTEDLDLSYRAQMKNWKIKYLEEVTAPAELPAEINGLKSQQFRWMKGGAETAKKLLPKVWKSPIKWMQKLQATVHLLSSAVFIFVFLMGVLSVPLLFLVNPLGIDTGKLAIFMLTLLGIIIVYFIANVGVAWPKENKLKMVIKFLLLFPIFLALSMGLAFHNSYAVIQGFLGKKTAFVRTPKYGIAIDKTKINKTHYISNKINWISIGEGILCLYFGTAVYVGYLFNLKDFMAFHIMLTVGYFILFSYTIQSKIAK